MFGWNFGSVFLSVKVVLKLPGGFSQNCFHAFVHGKPVWRINSLPSFRIKSESKSWVDKLWANNGFWFGVKRWVELKGWGGGVAIDFLRFLDYSDHLFPWHDNCFSISSENACNIQVLFAYIFLQFERSQNEIQKDRAPWIILWMTSLRRDEYIVCLFQSEHSSDMSAHMIT